jgi:hypothetical protein
MSDSPQPPTFDNTDLLNPAEPAASPVAAPLATENPVATAPQDPITGNGYTNTSNGNQVAVLSTIDYSTTNVTNNIYYINLEENNYINDSLNTSYNEHNVTHDDTPDSNNCTGLNSTDNLRPKRSLIRFGSNEYFRKKKSRVDRITDFDGTKGDRMELSTQTFKGIGELEFKTANNKRDLRRASKSSADIIYHAPSGKLFFNANGDTKGFGSQGGMFAILESAPILSADHFILI